MKRLGGSKEMYPRSNGTLARQKLKDIGPRFFSFFLVSLGLRPWHMVSFQARGQMGGVATGLPHSHSNAGSEPCL